MQYYCILQALLIIANYWGITSWQIFDIVNESDEELICNESFEGNTICVDDRSSRGSSEQDARSESISSGDTDSFADNHKQIKYTINDFAHDQFDGHISSK